MKKVKWATILFLLSFGAQALASLTISKMEVENQIRDRVNTIATKVDPTAFAQVQVNLKKIKSKLSFLGMETQVTPLENGQEIGPESIESIEIKILSKVDPFPEWIQKEIVNTVSIQNVTVNISYAKPETPVRGFTAQIAEFFSDEMYSSVTDSMKSVKWGIIVIGFFFIVCFSVLSWALMKFSKKLEDALQKVIAENLVPMATALGQIAGVSGNKPAQAAKPKDSPSAQAVAAKLASPDSKNQFEHYQTETLTALFVDCYWTHSDGYAHYLWSQLNPNQREAVVKSNVVDSQYFSHIIDVPPRPHDYHLHAWYLNPDSKFNKADQKALSVWAKQNLGAASMISPLRLDHLDLTLEEKIKMTTTKKVAADVKAIAAGVPRVFAQKLRITSLSESDELYLFKNFNQIQSETRPQLKTLVWLAIAPLEQRKKILDQMDARQLAEAWVAPKPVLEELKKSLPAKKLEMLDHFLKTTEPSRENDVYSYLVEAGLEASGPVSGKKSEAA